MKQLQTIKLTLEENKKTLQNIDNENPNIISEYSRKQMQPLGMMIVNNVNVVSSTIFYKHILQYKIYSNVKTDKKYLNYSLKCLKDLS